MINIVLYEPEIPQNTGNIMRTCAATGARLHLIRPLGFRLDENSIKRSGVNYIDKVDYTLYDDYEDFCSKNPGEYYFMTRYGKKAHSEFDYSDTNKNIYLIFGKESTGIPKEILRSNLDTDIDNLETSLNVTLPLLSMGMSQDYIPAIECGSTIVRVGSSIFFLTLLGKK